MTDTRLAVEVLRRVPGPAPARLAAQAVALLAVLSVPAALAVDPVATAVALLVLGGVTLARVLTLPATLQALLGAALVGAAWAGALGLYESAPWIDVPAHLAVNGLVAAAVGVVLLGRGTLRDTGTRAGRAGPVLTVASTGVALGALWEIAEWVGVTYVDDSLSVSYGDTIGDLAAGAVGSLVAGVLVVRGTR